MDDLKKDINWWLKYMPEFNGTATLWHNDYKDYDEVLATDACQVRGPYPSENSSIHPFHIIGQTYTLPVRNWAQSCWP